MTKMERVQRVMRAFALGVLWLHIWLVTLARKSQSFSSLERQFPSEDSLWLAPRRALSCSRSLRLGVTLVISVAIFGLAVPLVTPYAPDQMITDARLLPPSIQHPFGTDSLGRDMLSRIAFGSHLAAKMAFLSIGLSLSVGLVLGSLAGYHGGWIDQLISRAMDGWLALPGALVALVIVARLGASFENLVVALGLMGVPAFYRIVRGSTLSVRKMPFVEAAEALGATDRRIMWLHVFPNILSPIVVLATLHAGTALLTGSSLSFIGLGAQPPMPEWGALLAAGRTHFDTAWWLAVFPGLAVTVTVVGLNLLGDGLRDVLDPRFTAVALRGEGEVRQVAPGSSAACERGAGVSADGRAFAGRRLEPAGRLVVWELDQEP